MNQFGRAGTVTRYNDVQPDRLNSQKQFDQQAEQAKSFHQQDESRFTQKEKINIEKLVLQCERLTENLRLKLIENEQLKKELNEIRNQPPQQQVEATTFDKENIEYTLASKQLEMETLQMQSRKLEEAFVNQNQQLQDQQSQNAQLRYKIQNLEGIIDQMIIYLGEFNQIRRNYEQENQLVASLKQQNQILQNENQFLKQQQYLTSAEDVESVSNKFRQIIDSKEDKIKQLSNQIQKLYEMENFKIAEATKDYKNRILNLTAEQDNIKQQFAQEMQIASEKLKHEEIRVKQQFQAQIEELQRAAENLKNSLNESQLREYKLQQDLENVEEKWRKQIEDLKEEQRKEIQKKNNDIRPSEHLEYKVESIQQQLESKIKELNDRDQQIILMKNKLNQESEMSVKLQHENEILRDRIKNAAPVQSSTNNADQLKVQYLMKQVEYLNGQLNATKQAATKNQEIQSRQSDNQSVLSQRSKQPIQGQMGGQMPMPGQMPIYQPGQNRAQYPQGSFYNQK